MSMIHAQSVTATVSQPVRLGVQDCVQSRAFQRDIRVLVLEDNEFDQKRIARFCKETGFSVSVETIGCVTALRGMLDERKFDIVLVDFVLPDGDGLNAVRSIRSHPAHINCAVIMLTGHSDIDIAVEAMRTGCSDYIDKSALSANALRRSMSNALEKTSLQNELMRARGLQDKLQNMIADFAKDNFEEMKPLILTIMRQARSELASPTRPKNKKLSEIDQNCRKLWSLFEAMEENARRIK